MPHRTTIRAHVAPALLLVALLPLASAFAQDAAEPGELWETTTQMTMTGAHSMSMPATKGTLCRPKGEAWTEPPAPAESTCEMSDVTRSGNTMSWSMRCTNPPATGTGTMTFVGDASYTGEMTITMSEGTAVLRMSGLRTGECDAGAQKRQAAAMQAQAERGQAQSAQMMADMCAGAARSGQSYVFIGPSAMCKEPAQLTAFCAALSTEAGYSGAKANAAMGVDLAKAAATCNVDPSKIHDQLCVQALASDSVDFLAKECPEQAQVVAQRECAGRGYSAVAATKYQSFCSQYAQAEMEKQQAEKDAAEADPTNKAVGKAKKGLKGLFGK